MEERIAYVNRVNATLENAYGANYDDFYSEIINTYVQDKEERITNLINYLIKNNFDIITLQELYHRHDYIRINDSIGSKYFISPLDECHNITNICHGLVTLVRKNQNNEVFGNDIHIFREKFVGPESSNKNGLIFNPEYIDRLHNVKERVFNR